LDGLLRKATEDLGHATIRLKLKEGTQPIINAYQRVARRRRPLPVFAHAGRYTGAVSAIDNADMI
jgi:hypothetical protein